MFTDCANTIWHSINKGPSIQRLKRKDSDLAAYSKASTYLKANVSKNLDRKNSNLFSNMYMIIGWYLSQRSSIGFFLLKTRSADSLL